MAVRHPCAQLVIYKDCKKCPGFITKRCAEPVTAKYVYPKVEQGAKLGALPGFKDLERLVIGRKGNEKA